MWPLLPGKQHVLSGVSKLREYSEKLNIIRYGIFLTAGGISHLRPNLQNFGVGAVSTLALEVIISLAFFLACEVIYVHTYIILKAKKCILVVPG